MLYREVSLSDSATAVLFTICARRRNDAAFFSRTVRVLRVDVVLFALLMENILALCTGISSLNLTLFSDSRTSRYTKVLDMQHLSSLESLSLINPMDVRMDLDKLPPNITHLAVLYTDFYTGGIAGHIMDMLLKRPSITHILYGPGVYASLQHNAGHSGGLVSMLAEDPRPHLRVLVVLCSQNVSGSGEDPDAEDIRRVEEEVARMRKMEPRLVPVNSEKRYFGRMKSMLDVDLDKDDVWEKAEDFLRAARDEAT